MTDYRASRKPYMFAALAGLFAMPLSAFAFHPLVTDDTGTQGTGGNQLEIFYDYAKAKESGASETGRAVPLTYTRGVTDAVDAFIGVDRLTDPVSGWSNVVIGAKWRFLENEASKTSLAIKPEIALPVSESDEAKGLGNGETSWGLTLIFTQETSFGEWYLNAAVERANLAVDDGSSRLTTYRVSAAPVWKLDGGWTVALDVGLTTNPDRSQDYLMGFAGVGAAYSPNDNLDLSFGLFRDFMDGPVENTLVTLGLTWRF